MEIVSREEIERIMQDVVQQFLLPKFEDLGMNATGDWCESLEVRTEKNCGQIWGKDYTYFLAHGRPGGSLPPVKAIERWVKAKFGYSGAEAKSTAWAVAKNIEKQGTTWYKQGGTDLLEILNSQPVQDYIKKQLANVILLKVKHL